MTNRVQTQHSSSTGVRPTGRKPGELYVNLADMQYGVIDPTGTPRDLGGVRLFSANANYAIGDFVVQGGVLYYAKVAVTASVFDSTEWTVLGGVGHDIGSGYLPLAGGTLTGDLHGVNAYLSNGVVVGPSLALGSDGSITGLVAPVVASGAANKGYVDGTTQTVVQAGAGLIIDYSLGRECTLTLTANITSVSIINWPTTAGPAKIRLTIQNTGSFTIGGWPASVVWPGSVIPTITPNGTDVIELSTNNAGGTVYGAAWQGYAAITASIDGAGAVGSASNASVMVSAPITTTRTNDIILALIHFEDHISTGNVTSVSGGGLTWARRSQYKFTDTYGGTMEVWWAAAAAPLSSQSVTVTIAGGSAQFDAATIQLIAIHGVSSLTIPWDVNVSLPAKFFTSSTGLATVPISTTATRTMVIGFNAANSVRGATPGSGFIGLYQVFRNGVDLASYSYSDYQIFGSAQTGYSATMNVGIRSGLVFDALALT